MPHGRHAADDGRADQHHHERAKLLGLEHAHHALVTREQARHAARGGRVHGKQLARHVEHACQPAIAGHVQAVVVLGAEIEVGKAPVLEAGRQARIAADQRGGGEGMPLGLENLVILDLAELADRAIHRADKVRLRQRPRTFLQRPRKEVIEAGVARDVRIGGLAHIDAILGHEPFDQARGRRSALGPGNTASQVGEGTFRQKVLRQNFDAIGHGAGFSIRCRCGIIASFPHCESRYAYKIKVSPDDTLLNG
jgi:hypothetical protein